MSAIHRLIEQRVAMHGDLPALIDGNVVITYRTLNERANRVARYLITHGLKRGSLALVRMRRSCDLAVVLLAVLKAGAYYAWIEDDPRNGRLACALAVTGGPSDDEQQFLAVDVMPALEGQDRSPNLPVLTRSTDIACMLPNSAGSPGLLVPHATIASLLGAAVNALGKWNGEPGALDLWVSLISGTTVSISSRHASTAAA